MKTKKRLLSILLSLVLVLGLMVGMSLTAYAEGTVARVTNGGTSTEYATLAGALGNWTNGTTLTLLADVITDSTISVSDTKILDLNGYGIRFTGSDGSVITVNSGANLTLNDSGSTARNHYITLNTYRGTTVADSATEQAVTAGVGNGIVKVTGGYITGGNVTSSHGQSNRSDGGGVSVDGGTFIMKGGTIIGNRAVGDGGGVSLMNHNLSQFAMNGGKILYNYASGWGGGISVGVGGSNKRTTSNYITISGGEIGYNRSKMDLFGNNPDTDHNNPGNGGGIDLQGDSLLLSGKVVIQNNTTSKSNKLN